MNKFIAEFKPKPTDIALCGLMSHMEQWLPVIDALCNRGLTVSTPELSERIDWSNMTDEDTIIQKGHLVRRHIANISTAKAVLIANYEKSGIDNYIGSNTFLEMITAFVLEKPIYLLYAVSYQDNREEILALEPIVIDGDLQKVKV